LARTKAYEIGEKCNFDRSNPEYAAALQEEIMNLPGFEEWACEYMEGYGKWLKEKGKYPEESVADGKGGVKHVGKQLENIS